MTTFTDLYSTINIQDGMEADPNHANNFQRFLRAQASDQILEKMIAALGTAVSFSSTQPEFSGRSGTDGPTKYAYAVNPGGAFLRQGSANNKIQLSAGTLLQKIANADGNDSTLVAYSFVGTEEWTIASGDATNPRVDLLQMALSYITDTPASVDFQDAVTRALTTNGATSTRRRVQCVLSVKQGTPGASPVIPDPDSGFVPVGTAVVGHGWTSAGAAPIFGVDTAEANNVVIHDQRMPLGVRIYRLDPTAYKLETGWALSSSNQIVNASSGTNKLFGACPTHLGRLIALDLRIDTAIAAGAITMGAWRNAFTSAPSSTYIKGNTVASDVGAGTNIIRQRMFAFEGLHNPAAGPTIQPSAVNLIGVPLWTSGYRTAQAATGAILGWLGLGVINQTNNTNIGEAGFYVAGGL